MGSGFKKEIDKERLKILQEGLDECRNLQETLSVNIPVLFSAAVPVCSFEEFDNSVGIVKKMARIASIIHSQTGFNLFHSLSSHRSDIVRGVSCYIVALQSFDLEEKLRLIQPLADDRNSGVREWAWMAIRPHVQEELDKALELLTVWTADPSERIRRFASEITRPRGVWTSHLHILRKNPQKALHLLEPLKNDPARYVQLSVGNWLNDAGKDNPDWVIECCDRWLRESPVQETVKITKRGLRNLKAKTGQ